MVTFVGLVNEFFTAMIGWLPDLGDAILANDLLILPFVIMVVGLVVGIFGRILNVR